LISGPGLERDQQLWIKESGKNISTAGSQNPPQLTGQWTNQIIGTFPSCWLSSAMKTLSAGNWALERLGLDMLIGGTKCGKIARWYK
jgi:hypothetical protein